MFKLKKKSGATLLEKKKKPNNIIFLGYRTFWEGNKIIKNEYFTSTAKKFYENDFLFLK